jgi:hypothetical protein
MMGLSGKLERKKPLGRPTNRSEKNMKMNLKDRMKENGLDSSGSD